jgi:hypothetical protein
MFKEFTERKTSLGEKIKKIPLFIFAVGIFFLIIAFLFILANMLSIEDRREYRKTQEEEATLRRSLDVTVREAGYLRRSTGAREVFIPALILRVTNIAADPVKDLTLSAYFEREERFFCRGVAPVGHLEPGESRDVAIKCLELTGFGTIGTGLNLMQTTEPLSYEILAQAGKVTISPVKGQIRFKILSP